jgi:hypothetical protein
VTTKITDPVTAATLAAEAMESNAALIRNALTQMAERMADLPPLLDVRPEATAAGARLTLQTSTEGETRVWAHAFGHAVEAVEEDGYGNSRALRTVSEFVVGDVPVRLVSYETFSPSEWAARQVAAQVAA